MPIIRSSLRNWQVIMAANTNSFPLRIWESNCLLPVSIGGGGRLQSAKDSIWKRSFHMRTFYAAVVLASVAITTHAVADSINYDGLKYPDVTVNGIRNGQLYILIAGKEKLYD